MTELFRWPLSFLEVHKMPICSRNKQFLMPFDEDGWSYCSMFSNETSKLKGTNENFYKSFHYYTLLIKWDIINKVAGCIYFLPTLLHIEEIWSSKVRAESVCITSNFSVELDSTKAPPKQAFFGVLELKGGFLWVGFHVIVVKS